MRMVKIVSSICFIILLLNIVNINADAKDDCNYGITSQVLQKADELVKKSFSYNQEENNYKRWTQCEVGFYKYYSVKKYGVIQICLYWDGKYEIKQFVFLKADPLIKKGYWTDWAIK